MRSSVKIEVTYNDIISIAKDRFNKHLKASELTKVLNFIEEKHDCNISFWDNIERAIEMTGVAQ